MVEICYESLSKLLLGTWVYVARPMKTLALVLKTKMRPREGEHNKFSSRARTLMVTPI